MTGKPCPTLNPSSVNNNSNTACSGTRRSSRVAFCRAEECRQWLAGTASRTAHYSAACGNNLSGRGRRPQTGLTACYSRSRWGTNGRGRAGHQMNWALRMESPSGKSTLPHGSCGPVFSLHGRKLPSGRNPDSWLWFRSKHTTRRELVYKPTNPLPPPPNISTQATYYALPLSRPLLVLVSHWWK